MFALTSQPDFLSSAIIHRDHTLFYKKARSYLTRTKYAHRVYKQLACELQMFLMFEINIEQKFRLAYWLHFLGAIQICHQGEWRSFLVDSFLSAIPQKPKSHFYSSDSEVAT